MPRPTCPPGISAACVICLAIILYGSLLPLDFHYDAKAVALRLDRALHFDPLASKSDLICNYLLYIPLGFLLAARSRMRGGGIVSTLAAASVACLLLSVGVEGLQLLSPTRTSEIRDVVTNGLGGLTGSALGALAGRGLLRRLRPGPHAPPVRPALLATTLMCSILFADGWAPWIPVSSMSDLLDNIHGSCWSISQGLAVHPWHHWAVCRIGVFAVLTALLAGLRRDRSRGRALVWGLLAIMLAAVLESGKVFIYDRQFNMANLFMAAAGAGAGMVLWAGLRSRLSTRQVLSLWTILPLLYLAYRQWTPFAFAWDMPAMIGKLPHGWSWVPMADFAFRERRVGDVIHMARILVLAGTAGFAWRWRASPVGHESTRLLRNALWWAALGVLVALGQFLLPGREPSVNDVLALVVGGVLGAWLGSHMQGKAAAGSKLLDPATVAR